MTTTKTKTLAKSLIIGSEAENDFRPADRYVEAFNDGFLSNPSLGNLNWVDSSGTRSVFFYTKPGVVRNYKNASDLPTYIFEGLAIFFRLNDVPCHLFLLQEDPGIGIILPQDTEKNLFSYRETTSLANVADPIIKKFNYKKGKSVDAVCDFFLRRAN